MNTIRLLKGEGQYTEKEYKNFTAGDAIYGDNTNPIELARWNITNKAEAEAALAKYKCEYDYGELQNTYYVTEYALEYCDTDEDGEFVDGSDYLFASGGLTLARTEKTAYLLLLRSQKMVIRLQLPLRIRMVYTQKP